VSFHSDSIYDLPLARGGREPWRSTRTSGCAASRRAGAGRSSTAAGSRPALPSGLRRRRRARQCAVRVHAERRPSTAAPGPMGSTRTRAPAPARRPSIAARQPSSTERLAQAREHDRAQLERLHPPSRGQEQRPGGRGDLGKERTLEQLTPMPARSQPAVRLAEDPRTLRPASIASLGHTGCPARSRPRPRWARLTARPARSGSWDAGKTELPGAQQHGHQQVSPAGEQPLPARRAAPTPSCSPATTPVPEGIASQSSARHSSIVEPVRSTHRHRGGRRPRTGEARGRSARVQVDLPTICTMVGPCGKTRSPPARPSPRTPAALDRHLRSERRC